MTDSDQTQNRLNAFFKEWEALREKYKVDFSATITSDQLGDQTLAFVNSHFKLNKIDLVIRPQIQLVTDPNWQPSKTGDNESDPIPPDSFEMDEWRSKNPPSPRPPIPARRSRKRK